MSTNKIDLPISDIKPFVEDMLDQLGVECIIGEINTKIMISDLNREYDNIDENTKQAVCSKSIEVLRGTTIDFADGSKALVFSQPNDDIVSQSMKILICNSTIDVCDFEDIYNDDGDIVDTISVVKDTIEGFIERVSAREKMLDLGVLYETTLRFVTSEDANIELNDIVDYKGDNYRVIDIDDIKEGLLILQFESI